MKRDDGCWVLGFGYWVLGSGWWVSGIGFGVLGIWENFNIWVYIYIYTMLDEVRDRNIRIFYDSCLNYSEEFMLHSGSTSQFSKNSHQIVVKTSNLASQNLVRILTKF